MMTVTYRTLGPCRQHGLQNVNGSPTFAATRLESPHDAPSRTGAMTVCVTKVGRGAGVQRREVRGGPGLRVMSHEGTGPTQSVKEMAGGRENVLSVGKGWSKHPT